MCSTRFGGWTNTESWAWRAKCRPQTEPDAGVLRLDSAGGKLRKLRAHRSASCCCCYGGAVRIHNNTTTQQEDSRQGSCIRVCNAQVLFLMMGQTNDRNSGFRVWNFIVAIEIKYVCGTTFFSLFSLFFGSIFLHFNVCLLSASLACTAALWA